MPVISSYGYGWKEAFKRRKAKKAYWMKKGCTEWKAGKLLYRYGY